MSWFRQGYRHSLARRGIRTSFQGIMPMGTVDRNPLVNVYFKEINNSEKGNRLKPGDRLVPNKEGKLVSERHLKSALGIKDSPTKRDLEKVGDVVVPQYEFGSPQQETPMFGDRFSITEQDINPEFNVPMEPISTMPTVPVPKDRTASPTVEGGPLTQSEGSPSFSIMPPSIASKKWEEEMTAPRPPEPGMQPAEVATKDEFEPESLDLERH